MRQAPKKRCRKRRQPTAIHGLQCCNKIIEVGVLREQAEIAPHSSSMAMISSSLLRKFE